MLTKDTGDAPRSRISLCVQKTKNEECGERWYTLQKNSKIKRIRVVKGGSCYEEVSGKSIEKIFCNINYY